MIPLAIPYLYGSEWKYLKECLDTNWVSSVGPFVDRFEKMVAEYVGRPYAVACTSGTSALHVALIVAGVKAGDEVIVPALTFAAPAFAARYVGSWPTFVDVDPDTTQIDPEGVRAFLENECEMRGNSAVNRATGRPVRAIVPVHILGHPVDIDPLLELAKCFNLVVIEDAAESLGAKYKGRPVGALGHIACFSFNGNKIITTGGGGMIVTARKDWADKARYLTTQAKDDPIEYVHNEIGYNYRLTNIQAALGVAQMEKLNENVEAKRRIAERYTAHLKDIKGLGVPKEALWAYSTFWLYTVTIDPAQYGMGSRELMRALDAEQIMTRPLWHPLPSLPPFKECFNASTAVADRLYERALSLPCSVNLAEGDQGCVIQAIQNHAAQPVTSISKG